ncbi:unnamed protein product [Dovyalis caffra]|uniref:Calponin-homology (CH) domain-containing protein n=1 Tax=Dovyalis caffra TaxID=77055 RepID=A0AAV1SL56_9ROSI|nr:unnamed protein product [Dovyalis caffra]
MEVNEKQPCPSPYLQPFKDISNFKTPKRHSNVPKFTSPSPQFFSASKRTPMSSSSSFRPSLSGRSRPKPATTTARRRLKAFEIEQSQSSRKAEIKKEQSLKSLSKSLTTWLNFLFQNPSACGCSCNFNPVVGSSVVVGLGKRDGGVAGVGDTWRSPKRSRDVTWQGGGGGGDDDGDVLNLKRYGKLKEGLKEVCSVEDLMERMRVYLSLGCCKEVFDAMVLVVKTIYEGRLKMRSHCPIVTDVGMKEKAMRILMCYSPVWLRIGLHIILGGDSLLPNGDVDSDQEISFLKMVIEKQFLSHAGLAKAYAYNRKVEGLYRPGYYESLGNVILKRFLLLVLILDRAKLQSSLSLKYGIDGVDGGSPLLFIVDFYLFDVKPDFLSSEVMHGEGNLLAHLVIVGYKVSYQQCSLVEYDFRVTDLFAELQDGVRLCRAIQLLQNESSILVKLMVPSDSCKKHLANCGIALQYLKRAGVPLQDEDGMTITEDDVANGDKELTVSLLWNMFVHLQLPLLLNKTTLANEIFKIHEVKMDSSNNISPSSSPLELLLSWIQAVCGKYEHEIDNFASLVDGKAIWCLLDYYFRKELSCSYSSKDPHESRGEESLMSAIDYTDAVHNFLLSQKLTTLLWNFPEVLHISDILEHNGAINHRSVVVLLVFLSSQLTVKKTMTRNSSVGRCSVISESELDQDIIDGSSTEEAAIKFRAIKAWWQDMAERNNKFITKPGTSILECNSTSDSGIIIQRERWNQSENLGSYVKFIVDRHRFVKLRKAVILIQKAMRIWTKQRHKNDCVSNLNVSNLDLVNAAIVVQKFIRGWAARSRYIAVRLEKASSMYQFDDLTVQLSSKTVIYRSLHDQQVAATKIQSDFRGWLLRRTFLTQKQAMMKIQSNYRRLRCRRVFQQFRIAKKSAIVIQSYVRGWNVRREVGRYRQPLPEVISSIFKFFFVQMNPEILPRKAFSSRKHATIEIQRFVRGHIARNRLLGASHFSGGIACYGNFLTSGVCLQSLQLKAIMSSVLKLQRWWRGILLLKLRRKSAVVIQAHIRDLKSLLAKLGIENSDVFYSEAAKVVERQKACRERQRVVVVQSYWKGYLARKKARGQLLDLRLRVRNSAKHVDDSMRIINRLIVALSELSSMRSISGILHTCATLVAWESNDMATEHSQKCCEKLVAAGAIENLLKLIRSVSQSMPDQEVLKHALSVLRNLARYPHLIEEQGGRIFHCFRDYEEDLFKSERCRNGAKETCPHKEVTQSCGRINKEGKLREEETSRRGCEREHRKKIMRGYQSLKTDKSIVRLGCNLRLAEDKLELEHSNVVILHLPHGCHKNAARGPKTT